MYEHNYRVAQQALAELKSAILSQLIAAGLNGLTNAEVGRQLGIYGGHDGHEGHIPRSLLAALETEGVVKQDQQTKKWIAVWI